jgi:small-conductance mechanosensitive channel
MSGTRKWLGPVSLVAILGCLLAALTSESLAPIFGDAWLHIHKLLDVPLFALGKQTLTTFSIVRILVFIVGLGVFARLSMEFLQNKLLARTRLDEGQRYAMARVVSYLIFAFGIVVGFESLGLDLSSLVVLGGALGLGVGLGLQSVVSNFVAGLILLLEQPVRVGDRIEVGGTYGDIVAMRGRSTWIRTNDNVMIIVPNSDFIEKSVTNWTANDRQVRVNLSVGVSYDCNPGVVRDSLLRVAAANPDVLSDPAPDVIFEDFGDNSLDFQLRVWTISKVQIPAVLKSDLYFAIFEEFGKLQIEIPFPQRVLHLRSVAPEAAKMLYRSEGKTHSNADPL